MFLKAKDAIADARRAYDNFELQMQRESYFNEDPTYSGPCAIGVSLPAEKRKQLDSYSDYLSISEAVDLKLLQTDNLPALVALQNAHDDGLPERFETVLEELEMGVASRE